MEVYGGNEASRVRTKQLTFLWKAKSARIKRWWFETSPLYKAKNERRAGQIKLEIIEIIISHWRTDKGNMPSNAVLQRRKAEPAYEAKGKLNPESSEEDWGRGGGSVVSQNRALGPRATRR